MSVPSSTILPRSNLISDDADEMPDFDGAAEILRAWGAGLTPDADLTVSQWADRHRMLSGRASAEPGRYRTARTPYMAEIMDRLSPGDPAQRIVFMKAAQVAGATHFLWSRADAHEVLDVLVIDEAAQMSLANVLAVAQSAKALILLGDPQQLDQPMQGTHPDGTGVSALEHVLSGTHTISDDEGLFLEETWRLHPEICRFNSELFYDDKLHSVEGCELQEIRGGGSLAGTGLRFLPVEHSGNQNSSFEEADAVAGLVEEVLSGEPTWIDREGQENPLTLEDILIIAPYNAQVFEIQQRLPGARVGTVDKFQGQEAPIAIYSMATSSHADAPRGMEFLYSANRFNVAISRAKCVAVLVASPRVFEAECRTPRQMQLANAFCRYLELSQSIKRR